MSTTAARPNLLVFMTDDHGPWATRACGTRVIHSPAMDHIARTGARMSRAFTPCPVCSPARASFFTGLFPSQHGLHDYLSGDTHPGIAGQTNLGQRLQAGGYQTAMIGKWHCSRPQRQPGFDRWFTHAGNQRPHFGDMPFIDQDRVVQTHGQQSDTITQEAQRFIAQRDGQRPFFLFVSYVDTHTPYDNHPPRLVAQYRESDLGEIPVEPFAECHGVPLQRWPESDSQRQEELAQYLAAVTFIDEQVGRLLDTLRAQGLLENTLVVYTSDHGHNNGHHGIDCKGNMTTPQNFLDESIMVPLMLSWPGVIRPGATLEAPVDHCDLFATLLDAAGVELPRQWNSPGRSYLPMLRGQADTWREHQVCEYGNARMIRTPRWKLIRRYPGPNGHFPDELYDLANDPRETANVLADHAAVAASLGAELDAFFARHQTESASGVRVGQMPMCNPYEPWRRDPRSTRASLASMPKKVTG
jgi:arylsulfatase A-like enzyme